jgi:ribose-phosphate pyrophosphokinase
VDNLQQSSLKEVVLTNTVGVPQAKRFAKARFLSVAPLFSEAIKRIHTGESVGALFT